MPGFEIFGDEERREVRDVLETGVLFRYGFDAARKGHWKARSFETTLAETLGVPYCHLCASCTAALSIALAACGVGAEDEVILPPFTFVATMEAILFAGAIPVFSEIDNTLCLDPDRLEEAITPRTRAVVPVHMCGSMARIDAIRSLCDRRGLILIEDACQSVGARFDGKALGSFGHMGCFSFDPVKTITCGEGGAVITNREDLYLKADAYADHGHDHRGADRGAEGHEILGANYRISELNAAVGLAQLRKLPEILSRQRAHKAAIKQALAGCPGLTFRELPDPEGDSATFLSYLLISIPGFYFAYILIILVVNLQEELSGEAVKREMLNDVYRRTAADDPNGYLHYSEKQNVSCDIIGVPRAAAIIEGHETHTRTAEVTIDLGNVPNLKQEILAALKDTIVRIPVTQAVIYGWYDNEMGSYVNMLCDRTISVYESMLT